MYFKNFNCVENAISVFLFHVVITDDTSFQHFSVNSDNSESILALCIHSQMWQQADKVMVYLADDSSISVDHLN